MSEFENEVKKAEEELEKSLVAVAPQYNRAGEDEFLGDVKMQAQDYGQKFQDAAAKARDYATETLSTAGEKLKELQNKDPKELVEEAKQFARQKPGQAILISAAFGLVVGWILKRK
jgi:ElaB/YqjD/DUF883 family membrane-anchored ribosome-binding protein